MPRLRAVNVEFNVCRCGILHQSARCPGDACHEPFDSGRMRRISRLWLVVVADQVLYYHRVVRYCCPERAAHYRRVNGLPDEAPVPEEISRSGEWLNYCEPAADRKSPVHCPLCGHPVKPEQSHVWQRRFAHVDSLHDIDFDHRRLLTEDPSSEVQGEEEQP
jgi:hypothetical protein